MILLFALLLMQHAPRQRAASPGTSAPQVRSAEAVATFDGTFKSADKKRLLIEVENGQSMQMYITGRTKFIRDGRPAKASDFSNGESVTVDAERDARLNLIAVRIEAAKSKDQPGKQQQSGKQNDSH